ncbi:MAG: polyisoprenoid-binding protein [Gammaproteobacteria bacterium]|nr:polyisoprenoid-binding protein [Gammaproteobacteria bacterium]
MRKLILAAAVIALPVSAALADSYTIDPEHTFPHFAISHLGFSTMHGRFDKSSGKLNIDMAKKTASVEIVIDATSVDTAHVKRDQHLKSPDFFNAAEFPEIKFKSTKVTFTGDKVTSVDGDLTIMKTTKPVTLTVTSMLCAVHAMSKKNVCGFDANTKIKRSDFGVNYALPAIGDEVALTLEVEAIKD